MPSTFRSNCAALAAVAVLAVSCGDDDPVAGDDPCEDADATCLTLMMTPDDVSYSAVYDPNSNTTQHAISWSLDQVLSNYGAGQRIMVTVKFNPPVTVRYDHGDETLRIEAPALGVCYDRFGQSSPTFQSGGWLNFHATVDYSGECASGASRVVCKVNYASLDEGNELKQASWDFIVPATYSLGTNSGTPILAGDLTPMRVLFVGTTDGNTLGEPPVYPGEYDGFSATQAPASAPAQ